MNKEIAAAMLWLLGMAFGVLAFAIGCWQGIVDHQWAQGTFTMLAGEITYQSSDRRLTKALSTSACAFLGRIQVKRPKHKKRAARRAPTPTSEAGK